MTVERTESPSRWLDESAGWPGHAAPAPDRHWPDRQHGPDALSRRERQILVLLAEGASNREIGARAFVSENTVKYHLKNIFAKLGVHNRARAISLAHRRRLLD